MSNEELLSAISELLDEKLEQKLEEKLDEKLEQKLEEKLEQKLDEKLEQKLDEKLEKVLDEKFEQKLNPRFERIEQRLTNIELHLENVTDKNIALLAENYVPAAKRYEKSSAQIESMQTDIDLLKKVVAEHSQKLQVLA